MARTIIIGDVHGCIDELEALLEVVEVQKSDRVIFIGDLINKGPNSLAVWQLKCDLGAESVLGNHELRVLEAAAGRASKSGIHDRMKKEFGKHFPAFLKDAASWPLYIKEKDFIAVHAGIVPNKKLLQSTAAELCNIRTWDGEGRDLQNPNNPPWYKFVKRKHLVVFGHWAAKLGVFDEPGFVGLDTGCVYGKELSALVLPDLVVHSIESREQYVALS